MLRLQERLQPFAPIPAGSRQAWQNLRFAHAFRILML
jgi:hypothetical protein